MAGVGLDTKIYPSENYDRVTFSSDRGGVGPSTMSEIKRHEREKYLEEVQTNLTMEEASYSEMRKKIPGLGRIPKDRINLENQDSELQKRKKEHTTFIKQNFHQIECSIFVPDPKKLHVKKIRDLKCYCGEILTEHAGLSKENLKNAEKDFVYAYLVPEKLRTYINRNTLEGLKAPPENLPAEPWSKDEAFRKSICNTFGKISFVNNNNAKPAKYIRLSHNDSVDKCLELMDKHWKIMEPTRPSLCISVIGGAKSFKLDNKMRETFNAGLIKAAKSTNAWLITTGSNVGVMKAVGNAVSEGQSFLWDNDRITHTLRLIGIGPWGYVKDRKLLESDGEGLFPAHFKTSNIILHGKPVPLNPNHTHFVFVDDGFRNDYKGASEFRAKFEQKVSKPTEDRGLGIPVVLVILEGGTDAIHDAMVSLNHNIPVVVCSGTGRAADILAYAFSHTRSNKGVMKQKHEDKLREKIFDAYGERWKEKEKEINKHLKNVKKCMEHRDLINIFPMNKHEDLDIAILTALLNSKAGETSREIRLSQLKLALTWNRADIAQEEIFREDILWRDSLNDFLTEAILEDRVEFVALILQQNVVMQEFLTRSRLKELYEKSLQRTDGIHLQKLMARIINSVKFSYDNLAILMNKMMDKYDHDFEDESVEDGKGKKMTMQSVKTLGQQQFKFPYKQLMIWSILMLRQKMAKFAWQMGSEPVTSAVAASRIYGSMAKKNHRSEATLKETILQYRDEFEHLAKSVLDECHLKHQEKAMMLAERKSPTWSSMTSLQISASAENRVYLSAAACRNSIDATWRRGLHSPWKCFSYLLIGCLKIVLSPHQEPFTHIDGSLVLVRVCSISANARHFQPGEGLQYISLCTTLPAAFEQEGILSCFLLLLVLVTVFFPFLLLTPFLEVNAMGEKRTRTFQKILTFYTAPITKFTHHSFLYMVFVVLFTYFLLVDYRAGITNIEIICIVWIFTFIIDELYTLLTFPSPTFRGKLKDWYGIIKFIEDLNLLVALIAFFVRSSSSEDHVASDAKIIYSINSLIFYLRIMKLYTANSSLGPKLVMIKMMFDELMTFLLVVIVFLLAYGVASQSLLFRQREASWNILKGIVFHPYWQLYGELDFANSAETDEDCILRNTNTIYYSTPIPTSTPLMSTTYLGDNTRDNSTNEMNNTTTSIPLLNTTDLGNNTWNNSTNQMNNTTTSTPLRNTSDLGNNTWNNSTNQMNNTTTSIPLLSTTPPGTQLNYDYTFKCQQEHWLVYILCAGYLLMGNILLFNLLIAIFNHIFTKVEEKSNEIWKFQMYFLTMEFDNKTALVPPLSIFPHLYLCIKWLARKTCCKKRSKGVQFTQRHLEFLQLFEKEEMANYLRRLKAEQKDSTESKLQKRVEELFKLVEEELTADQVGSSLNHTLNTTQLNTLPRETTMDTIPMEASGWPKPEAVIEYAKKLEEKDRLLAKDEAKEDIVDEAAIRKENKRRKKNTKGKKHKKEKHEEKKINSMDQQYNAKPESEAFKIIPAPAWEMPTIQRGNFSARVSSQELGLRIHLPRGLSQNNISDESVDSEDNVQVKGPESYNILSTPRRSRRKLQVSDSDSDTPTTEDERGLKRMFSKRRRSRRLSDSD